MKPPKTKEIRSRRAQIGFTQSQAAQIIYCSMRTWQEWEGGRTKMHPAFWELWMLRTDAMRERLERV